MKKKDSKANGNARKYMIIGRKGNTMKNLAKVSEASKRGRVKVYYDIRKDAVFTQEGKDRYHVTDLIRFNTEEEIESVVNRFLGM